jgi:hypothetical protein
MSCCGSTGPWKRFEGQARELAGHRRCWPPPRAVGGGLGCCHVATEAKLRRILLTGGTLAMWPPCEESPNVARTSTFDCAALLPAWIPPDRLDVSAMILGSSVHARS